MYCWAHSEPVLVRSEALPGKLPSLDWLLRSDAIDTDEAVHPSGMEFLLHFTSFSTKQLLVHTLRSVIDSMLLKLVFQLGLYWISAPALAGIRHFSKSGWNLARAKIPPEPDSFAGFEKSQTLDILGLEYLIDLSLFLAYVVCTAYIAVA